MINQFREAANGHLSDAVGLEAARQTLDDLLKYTEVHFASEERLLASCQFPELAAHKQKHQELTAAVQKLCAELAAHSAGSTPLKLNLFVTVWLLEHIMSEDWKYSRFIIAQRGAA